MVPPPRRSWLTARATRAAAAIAFLAAGGVAVSRAVGGGGDAAAGASMELASDTAMGATPATAPAPLPAPHPAPAPPVAARADGRAPERGSAGTGARARERTAVSPSAAPATANKVEPARPVVEDGETWVAGAKVAQAPPSPAANSAAPDRSAASDLAPADLVGVVTDRATGRPLAGAQVRVQGTAAVTDSAGRFAIRGAPAGTQQARVRRAGYAANDRTVEVVPGSEREVSFTMDRSTLSRSAVTGPEAQPLANEERARGAGRVLSLGSAPTGAPPPPPALAGASAAAGAARGFTVREVAGCYTLALSPWVPALELGADARSVALPSRIVLDSTRADDSVAAVQYRILAAPGVPRSVHRSATWAPIPARTAGVPDSVQLSWSTGVGGVRMRLARDGEMLRGEATAFWEVDRPTQRSTVRATRIPCPRD